MSIKEKGYENVNKPRTAFFFGKDVDQNIVSRKVNDLLNEKNIMTGSLMSCSPHKSIPHFWLCVYNFGQEDDAVEAIEGFDWPSIGISAPRKKSLGIPVRV